MKLKMSNLIFYDLETSGRGENHKKTRNGQWDQILQVGAILCDENLVEKDRFEIKCNLLLKYQAINAILNQ